MEHRKQLPTNQVRPYVQYDQIDHHTTNCGMVVNLVHNHVILSKGSPH